MKKILKNKKLFLLIFSLCLVLGLACFSFAQGLETNWPPAPGGKTLADDSTLLDFIDYVYRWGLLVGGLAAFFALIFAGFKYLTSIGDPSKMSDAKERIIAALAGLILLLSTFLILNTINPDLTTLQLPTTTIGGYTSGNVGSGPSNKPCKSVIFYRATEYDGLPTAAYFNDSANWPAAWLKCSDCIFPCNPGVECVIELEANGCKSIGHDDFFGLFGEDIPFLSEQIDGDCVVNLYSEEDCKGNQTAIFLSDQNSSGLSKQDLHSMMLVDREAPTNPVVSNDDSSPQNLCPALPAIRVNPALAVTGSAVDTSGKCQVYLRGFLDGIGDPPNDYVNLYFIYGKSPMRISYTWPPYDDIDNELWDSITPPSGMPDPLWKELKQKDKNSLGDYGYIITGLDITDSEGNPQVYYWTAKGVTKSGGKYDVAEPLCQFSFVNVCNVMRVEKYTP